MAPGESTSREFFLLYLLKINLEQDLILKLFCLEICIQPHLVNKLGFCKYFAILLHSLFSFDDWNSTTKIRWYSNEPQCDLTNKSGYSNIVLCCLFWLCIFLYRSAMIILLNGKFIREQFTTRKVDLIFNITREILLEPLEGFTHLTKLFLIMNLRALFGASIKIYRKCRLKSIP